MSGNRAAYIDLDGTLLGAGGALLRDGAGAFTRDGVEALAALHAAGVAVILTSGRSRPRLEAVRATVGADGLLAEMGAVDCGYPTAPGQSVHAAIAATGIPAALVAREPGLIPHPAAQWGREGSHVFAGRASAETVAWVATISAGSLRLADNGRIGEGVHIFHLLPSQASKAAAVARHVAEAGFDPSECVAIGDSRQDLDMGRAVATVAIVANGAAADEALAADAPWVTRASHGAGVREAVEEWLAGRRGVQPPGGR